MGSHLFTYLNTSATYLSIHPPTTHQFCTCHFIEIERVSTSFEMSKRSPSPNSNCIIVIVLGSVSQSASKRVTQ